MNTEAKWKREVKMWRLGAVAACAVAGFVALGGLNAQNGQGAKKVIGVSGGDTYIYRVYDDGSIDFIQADGSIKSPKGIPNWVAIPIDPDLKRQTR